VDALLLAPYGKQRILPVIQLVQDGGGDLRLIAGGSIIVVWGSIIVGIAADITTIMVIATHAIDASSPHRGVMSQNFGAGFVIERPGLKHHVLRRGTNGHIQMGAADGEGMRPLPPW